MPVKDEERLSRPHQVRRPPGSNRRAASPRHASTTLRSCYYLLLDRNDIVAVADVYDGLDKAVSKARDNGEFPYGLLAPEGGTSTETTAKFYSNMESLEPWARVEERLAKNRLIS